MCMCYAATHDTGGSTVLLLLVIVTLSDPRQAPGLEPDTVLFVDDDTVTKYSFQQRRVIDLLPRFRECWNVICMLV